MSHTQCAGKMGEADIRDSGGSILTELLTFDHKLEISALVRSDNHIEAINNLPTSASIKAIKFSGLDDTEWLKRAASDYDGIFIICLREFDQKSC